MILIKRRWTQQPPEQIGIDWSNPICRGLEVCIVQGADLIGKYRTIAARPARTKIIFFAGGNGSGVQTLAGANTFRTLQGTEFYIDSLISKQSEQSCAQYIKNSQDRIVGHVISGYGFQVLYSNTDYSTRNAAYSVSEINGIDAFVQSNVVCNGDEVQTWVNGKELSSPTLSGSAQTSYSIGSSTFAVDHGSLCATAFTRFWSRKLQRREIASLRENPWQIFAPRQIIIPTSAGGGIVTPTLTSATAINITTTSARARAAFTRP